MGMYLPGICAQPFPDLQALGTYGGQKPLLIGRASAQ